MNRARAILNGFLALPRQCVAVIGALRFAVQGFNSGKRWKTFTDERCLNSASAKELSGVPSNPLRSYFDSCVEGWGIWKWLHYFDIYHRHFSKFIGQDVRVLEIGI